VFDTLDDNRIFGTNDQHDSTPIALPDSGTVRLVDQRQRPGMTGERPRPKLLELSQQSGSLARRHLPGLQRSRSDRRYDQPHEA
jgi:hypothetical protein